MHLLKIHVLIVLIFVVVLGEQNYLERLYGGTPQHDFIAHPYGGAHWGWLKRVHFRSTARKTSKCLFKKELERVRCIK